VITVPRRSWFGVMAGVLIACALFAWGATQFGHASPNAKTKPEVMPPQQPTSLLPAQQGGSGAVGGPPAEQPGQPSTAPRKTVQGPALDVPEEVLALLDQRKRSLDRREETVKQQEERLLALRTELDKLLVQNEAIAKRIEAALAKEAQQTAFQKAAQAKALQEKERLVQEQRAQLAKMYETMPPEDAAARLERMPERTAIEILRLVKTKTAGAILAQVKPERAAKLTEQLLAQTP
jgi:flagellar motility protein MotE (MotC chaperone)